MLSFIEWLKIKIKLEIFFYVRGSYTIEKNGLVNFDGDTFFSSKYLKSIPIKIGKVNGNFLVTAPRLETFKNFPDIVTQSLFCNKGNVNSTEHLTPYVLKTLDISDQKISDISNLRLTYFKSLVLDGNPIKVLDLNNLKLDPISGTASFAKAYKWHMTNINNPVLASRRISLENCGVESVQNISNFDRTVFNLSHNNITLESINVDFHEMMDSHCIILIRDNPLGLDKNQEISDFYKGNLTPGAARAAQSVLIGANKQASEERYAEVVKNKINKALSDVNIKPKNDNQADAQINDLNNEVQDDLNQKSQLEAPIPKKRMF